MAKTKAKTKKRVAKNKPSKKVSKRKSPVSSSRSRSRRVNVRGVSKTRGNNLWTFFLNTLFFVLFVYAGYLLWFEPWTKGVSLIVVLLIIILLGRLIRKR
jgi:Flp pilus assembly protein TadB